MSKDLGGVTEAVARAIATAGFIDLSMAINEAGGIVAAVETFEGGDDFDDPRWARWRIPSCRGVVDYANAAIAAMQAAAPAAVADGERSAIVSWLRLVAKARDDRADVEWAECLTEAADFIEKGEHRAVAAERG